MVVHAFNPSTWEAEAGGFLRGQSSLKSEFQDSQGFTEKPCLKIKQNKKKKKNNGGGPGGRPPGAEPAARRETRKKRSPLRAPVA